MPRVRRRPQICRHSSPNLFTITSYSGADDVRSKRLDAPDLLG